MNELPRDAELTELIRRTLGGEDGAEERLIEALYDQLRERARHLVAAGEESLPPTMLVNDLWMKIFHGDAQREFENRDAFFGFAIKTMRNLLRDHYRARQRMKRGGDRRQDPIDVVLDQLMEQSGVDFLDLDEALESLKQQAPRQYRVVHLKFFWGFTNDEVARHLDVSRSTVEGDWRLARAKLFRALEVGRGRGSELAT